MQSRSGGEILVASLLAQDATHLFGVPGESFLPVLDALVDVRDRLSFVVCRQEGGAAYMAEAAGKLTGRPGVAIVTRGPGATNAAIGVHVARQDSTPMVLLVGQVGSDATDREAFQEIDYRRMYGDVAKWAAQIDRADRIPEYVAHAWRLAMSGRPGPVVLALPEDVLSGTAVVADAPRAAHTPAAADPAQVAGSAHGSPPHARRSCSSAAVAGTPTPAPISPSSRGAGRCPSPARSAGRTSTTTVSRTTRATSASARTRSSPRACATPTCVVAIGERLGEMTTSGYTLLDAPSPRQALVHVHPGGRGDRSGLPAGGRHLRDAGRVPGRDARRRRSRRRRAVARERASANADYEAWREARPVPGAVDLWRIVRWLDERLPDDAILANGAGNYTTWLHRLYRHRGIGTQLAPYASPLFR